MGAGASVAVVEEERLRPLDASDVNTPRGESAKREVMRLRALLAAHSAGAPPPMQEYGGDMPTASGDYSDPSAIAAAEEAQAAEAYQGMAPGIQEFLTEVFRAADTDFSGVLSYDEFTRMLRDQAGVLGLSDEDFQQLEAAAAWSPGGEVTWSEFVLIAPQLLKHIMGESSEPSPSDWCVLTTPDGTLYYVNKRTQESSWTRPAELGEAEAGY